MKIAILSDFHLGFSFGPETERDSFENAEEAISRASNSDLIIIAGDIFDSRSPKTQTWAEALKIFSQPLLRECTGVKLVSCTKELKDVSKKALNHLPIVAIHGNHERRSKGEVTPVEALENAGMLIHLHLQTVVFEKDGVKVAIHGMSSVPERYAKDVLERWNPKPLEGCFNILLLHQSIDPYVYSPLEPPTLNLESLPKGFDLIVDGHVHTHALDKCNGTPFCVVGSTTFTQLQKSEADSQKGFVMLEIKEKAKLDFVPLEKCRKFFYEEIEIGEHPRSQIEKKISDIISLQTFEKEPIIRIKILGEEGKITDKELREIEKKFAGKAIIFFSKELESKEVSEKIEFLRNLRDQKLSIEEIGLNILKKNLEELNFKPVFDHEKVFWLLSEGKIEDALNLILGEQKTLDMWKSEKNDN
jgi:DNA repair exonuclease SbcCD nuclease subunit